MKSLERFAPSIREWFSNRFPEPTDVQARAWPHIADGEHVLLTAPTGSGKTLTAFLWAIDRLAAGAWGDEGLSVLYISPLKALNNDIRRNLLEPLGELGLDHIDVQTRSGDTPQADRRRMLKRPPRILVTTPESLNLLLSSHGGRRILGGVKTVVLDEIHAVAGNKRGTYLMTAVERLAELAGEFQRIALSATVRPLETIADFVGGGRPVRVVDSSDEKRLYVTVHALDETGWPRMVEEFRGILERNRSTLFFVNNRALSENLARWLNEGEDEPVAYAHHGSLSREIRALVEQRLKDGSLKAIIATSSLEMGIDIGHLDEVVLVQSPKTVNSAIQRVGRAGHLVGETSVGRLYPTYGRDYLDAAVLAPQVMARASEHLRPVRNPLDVLAQVITAMCGVEERDLDGLYAFFRRCWSYRTLQREAFDRVVAMLTGRYADTRIRELRPRLRLANGKATARDGVLPLVWRSGGVIPDRGYYTLRVEGSGARLGELDEEFVWERRPGHRFSMGAQTWMVTRITKSDVEVVADHSEAHAPFWRAERFDRGYEYSEQVGLFLERADGRLDDPSFREELMAEHRMDEGAADQLLHLLRRQRELTGKPLPHRHHMLIEHCTGGAGENRQIIFHANWGGQVLRPLGLAIMVASKFSCETFVTDDCLLVQVPDDASGADLLRKVRADNVEALVRERLESTGFFGARFRENAMRALLLPRYRGDRRMPLWLSRHRAKKLMQSVGAFGDFPIVAETWRTCLEDEFDLENLRRMLDEVQTGEIALAEIRSVTASPFSEGVSWHSTNQLMYDDDRPLSETGSISDRALREVLHDSALRPELDPALVEEFEAKLQGTAEGYGYKHLADEVEDRLLVPVPEDFEEREETELAHVARVGDWLVPAAQRPRIERARAGDERALAECIAEFLQTHGPVTRAYLEQCWETAVDGAVERLLRDGRLVATGADAVCDAGNLERLLRLSRAKARPSFEALPLSALPLWRASHQGITVRGNSLADLRNRLEPLFGYAAPAALWEGAILRARLEAYDPAWLDRLMLESDLLWFGAGMERAGFCFRGDLDLFLPEAEEGSERDEGRNAGPALPPGSHDFFELQERTGRPSDKLARDLWRFAWEGRALNDTFAALRKGVETKFAALPPTGRKRGVDRWAATRPLLGRWRSRVAAPPGDRLQQAEDDKDRARQLLARHGVLFRELCTHELPALRWGRLLKALRVLELSGEILAGHFFAGVDGLQFATHDAFRRLREPPDRDAIWWLNACDPASLCGAGLPALDLPARLPGTWLVYHGARLAMVARKHGAEIDIFGDPDERVLGLFRELRELRGRVDVDLINGEDASASEHAELLASAGFWKDRKRLCLERTFE